jgi:anti-sigma-K factor RskA
MTLHNTDTEQMKAEPGEGGFIVPGDYFNTSRSRILNATVYNGFTVDSAYFEQLTAKIESRTSVQQSKLRVLYRNMAVAVSGVAAALAICFTFYFDHHPGAAPHTPDYTIAQLSREEILAYVDVADLNDETIQLVAGENMNLPDDAISRYLMENPEGITTDEL